MSLTQARRIHYEKSRNEEKGTAKRDSLTENMEKQNGIYLNQ